MAEMEWTILGFMRMAFQWQVLSGDSITEGQRAYAEKQRHMWQGLQRDAEKALLKMMKGIGKMKTTTMMILLNLEILYTRKNLMERTV